jgi:hypothetical protein
MAKTKAQKERHKRWLKKHPEKVIARLEKWVSKEKNPKELARAKRILKHFRPPVRPPVRPPAEEVEKLKKELEKMSGAFKKLKKIKFSPARQQ